MKRWCFHTWDVTIVRLCTGCGNSDLVYKYDYSGLIQGVWTQQLIYEDIRYQPDGEAEKELKFPIFADIL